MASKILYDNLSGKETAFDPENLIVIATGPLTGTGAPSSNRFDISSLSPLTGITSSSNCGGNFGHYLKKAGLDALIIRGKCEKPTWVEIENGEFRFHDAAELWGMKVSETQETLQKTLNAAHGKPLRCGMVVIGPAGENRACVWASLQITPRGCLSRSAAGIRGKTLIVNLPGSEKAARENLAAVIDALGHGLEMLYAEGSSDHQHHHHHGG